MANDNPVTPRLVIGGAPSLAAPRVAGAPRIASPQDDEDDIDDAPTAPDIGAQRQGLRVGRAQVAEETDPGLRANVIRFGRAAS